MRVNDPKHIRRPKVATKRPLLSGVVGIAPEVQQARTCAESLGERIERDERERRALPTEHCPTANLVHASSAALSDWQQRGCTCPWELIPAPPVLAAAFPYWSDSDDSECHIGPQ
jgi:hypothetical protein